MPLTKLHEQARRRIERLITDRALKPGSQLPTETDLASELYVSRTTIRNALKVLEQEGKIGSVATLESKAVGCDNCMN